MIIKVTSNKSLCESVPAGLVISHPGNRTPGACPAGYSWLVNLQYIGWGPATGLNLRLLLPTSSIDRIIIYKVSSVTDVRLSRPLRERNYAREISQARVCQGWVEGLLAAIARTPTKDTGPGD